MIRSQFGPLRPAGQVFDLGDPPLSPGDWVDDPPPGFRQRG
jgi:hypothetical protein